LPFNFFAFSFAIASIVFATLSFASGKIIFDNLSKVAYVSLVKETFLYLVMSVMFTSFHVKYKNVSLTKETYATLDKLSKIIFPDAKLSVAKTIEAIANEKAKKLNGKFKKS
jgi:hypothetical protein